MLKNKTAVETAIKALQEGKIILLTDPADRENEGDFVFPAETITPEIMNFMIRNGSGIVCVSLPAEHLQRLKIPVLLPHQSTNRYGTPFAMPVEARDGVTTGVSAADRTKTIQALMNPNAQPEDLARPGHVYPLQAKAGGVLERQGHTEGSLDIVTLAGFRPGAVICEAMHADGTMVKGQDLVTLAKTHEMPVLTIDDLMAYRLATENLIEDIAEAALPTEQYGDYRISIIKEKYTQEEHTVLFKTPLDTKKPVLTRIHSCCQTGDLFGSLRCDCQKQLEYALKTINTEGGLLIYLNQEGRGIGLFNKIKAYALQEQGLDTVDANIQLGFSADLRCYHMVPSILRHLNISRIRLLTNNPAKIAALQQCGIEHIERAVMPVFANPHNQQYLATKKNRLNHQL